MGPETCVGSAFCSFDTRGSLQRHGTRFLARDVGFQNSSVEGGEWLPREMNPKTVGTFYRHERITQQSSSSECGRVAFFTPKHAPALAASILTSYHREHFLRNQEHFSRASVLPNNPLFGCGRVAAPTQTHRARFWKKE
jgi:hypothetical protein